MGPSKQTFFQDSWLQESIFKNVIGAHPTLRTHAVCILCKDRDGKPRPIFLSNMGRQALVSHLNGTGHKKREEAKRLSFGMGLFVSRVAPESAAPQDHSRDAAGGIATVAAPAISASGPLSDASVACQVTATPSTAASGSVSSSASQLHGLKKYILKDDVSRAEIWWCLFAIEYHMSMRSAGTAYKIFVKMFPDCDVAQAMALARTKITYNIIHGIAPYFHSLLVDDINKCDAYVVFFDESLNKCSQQQQMDIAIRFVSNDEVTTRYFTSAFLGHATAVDLLKAILESLKSLTLSKMIQLSMDGPNVNLKLVSDLETYLTKTNDEDDPMFVFMGTCGLHVVNNAFKTGFSDKFSKWYVISFLRSLYNLFKDVPARRSDLIRHSNSHLMPLKFCSVRWLNNAAVALRAKDMLPNLADFKSGIEADPDHKGIKSYSWGVVKDALKDKLMPVRLSFFALIAGELEPFLTKFQSDAPMAPFLYTELKAILSNLFSMIVQQEVLNKETSIWRIDLNDEKILISPKNFSFRFSIKAEISKLKLTKEEMQTFKEDCVKIIKAICLKILDKSPLKYKLCRAIRFCDPALLADDTKVCLTRLENALTVFMEKKWIKGTQGDALLKEFKELCSKPSVKASFGLYDKEKERLDHFWRTVVATNKSSDLLWSFLQKVLILSQGNAFVERGFSINKEVIIENQQNKSLVGQRQVYDGIKNLGGVLEMTDIPKQMILKVRNSRELYQESLKKSREEKQEKGMEETQRKRLAEEVKELKKKKVKLLADQQKEIDKIDEELVMLCGASVLV